MPQHMLVVLSCRPYNLLVIDTQGFVCSVVHQTVLEMQHLHVPVYLQGCAARCSMTMCNLAAGEVSV